MPLIMPAFYDFQTKTIQIHKFNKKKRIKVKPYGWKELTIKDIEDGVLKILMKYNTRKNNPRTWKQVKKEIDKYLDYLWKMDNHGFSVRKDFISVKCSYPETMAYENLMKNELVVAVCVTLDKEKIDDLMCLTFLQNQIVK